MPYRLSTPPTKFHASFFAAGSERVGPVELDSLVYPDAREYRDEDVETHPPMMDSRARQSAGWDSIKPATPSPRSEIYPTVKFITANQLQRVRVYSVYGTGTRYVFDNSPVIRYRANKFTEKRKRKVGKKRWPDVSS